MSGAVPSEVGAQLKFVRDRFWWTVRAADERYVILTRATPFRSDGMLTYTIVDLERGHRGPCNLIGQGWEFDPANPEAGAQKLLVALNGGSRDDEDDWHDWIPSVEITTRNRVATRVAQIRSTK